MGKPRIHRLPAVLEFFRLFYEALWLNSLGVLWLAELVY